VFSGWTLPPVCETNKEEEVPPRRGGDSIAVSERWKIEDKNREKKMMILAGAMSGGS
jgi:hypothetical protein